MLHCITYLQGIYAISDVIQKLVLRLYRVHTHNVIFDKMSFLFLD